MVAPAWATAEQTAFLQSHFADYMAVYCSSRNYTSFWASMKKLWFENYPELPQLYPGLDEWQLSNSQVAIVSEAMKARLKQLKSWYRWRANPSTHTGRRAARLPAVTVEPRKRELKPYELYSKKFYDSKIKTLVADEVERLGGRDAVSVGERLNITKRLTKKLYDEENDEVKAEIQLDLEKSREITEKEAADPIAKRQRAVDNIPNTLNATFSKLSEETNWAFTVLMGGRSGDAGDIVVASFHNGQNRLSFNFGQAYSEFEARCLVPYTHFLESVFPHTQNESLSGQTTSSNEDPPPNVTQKSPKTSPAAGVRANNRGGSPARPNHTVSDVGQPSNASPAARTNACSNGPSLNTSPLMHDRNEPQASALTLSASSPAVLNKAPQLSFDEFDPFNYDASMDLGTLASGSDNSWMDDPCFLNMDFSQFTPESLGLITMPSPSASSGISPTSGFTSYNLLDATAQNTFGSSSIFKPSVMGSPPFTDYPAGAASPFLPNHPIAGPIHSTYAPAGILCTPAATFSINGGTASETAEGSSSTLTLPGSPPQPLLAQLQLSPAVSSNPSLPPVPLVASNEPAPPAQTLVTPLTNEATNTAKTKSTHAAHTDLGTSTLVSQLSEILPASLGTSSAANAKSTRAARTDLGTSTLVSQLSEILPPPLGTSSAANAKSTEANTSSEADTRRSSRGHVPSKRISLMQSIGTQQTLTMSSAAEKENLPPDVPPTWATLAKNHLLVRDLGSGWSLCVKLWFEVEDTLGYGTVAGTKSSLPSISLRPEEWSRWVGKTRQGERTYHQTPPIADPAEFGIALVKWWNSMQPLTRQSSSGGIPQAIGLTKTIPKEDWLSLRRAGPNGLVSVMTLLVWWGQILESRTCWQQDSSQLWAAMVTDVSAVLQILKAIGRPTKRKAGGGDKENAKKAKIIA